MLYFISIAICFIILLYISYFSYIFFKKEKRGKKYRKYMNVNDRVKFVGDEGKITEIEGDYVKVEVKVRKDFIYPKN